MSEPYTPSMDELRCAHRHPHYGLGEAEMDVRFDRAIAAHDAKVAAQAVTAERAKVVTAIAEVDKSPAVTWAGHGGAREVLRRALSGAHDGGAES